MNIALSTHEEQYDLSRDQESHAAPVLHQEQWHQDTMGVTKKKGGQSI
jgi:hypothetical protein